MTNTPRLPSWAGHRVVQAVCAVMVLAGALLLWLMIRDGAEWYRSLQVAGTMLLFLGGLAVTVEARRQNQRSSRP